MPTGSHTLAWVRPLIKWVSPKWQCLEYSDGKCLFIWSVSMGCRFLLGGKVAWASSGWGRGANSKVEGGSESFHSTYCSSSFPPFEPMFLPHWLRNGRAETPAFCLTLEWAFLFSLLLFFLRAEFVLLTLYPMSTSVIGPELVPRLCPFNQIEQNHLIQSFIHLLNMHLIPSSVRWAAFSTNTCDHGSDSEKGLVFKSLTF